MRKHKKRKFSATNSININNYNNNNNNSNNNSNNDSNNDSNNNNSNNIKAMKDVCISDLVIRMNSAYLYCHQVFIIILLLLFILIIIIIIIFLKCIF